MHASKSHHDESQLHGTWPSWPLVCTRLQHGRLRLIYSKSPLLIKLPALHQVMINSPNWFQTCLPPEKQRTVFFQIGKVTVKVWKLKKKTAYNREIIKKPLMKHPWTINTKPVPGPTKVRMMLDDFSPLVACIFSRIGHLKRIGLVPQFQVVNPTVLFDFNLHGTHIPSPIFKDTDQVCSALIRTLWKQNMRVLLCQCILIHEFKSLGFKTREDYISPIFAHQDTIWDLLAIVDLLEYHP